MTGVGDRRLRHGAGPDAYLRDWNDHRAASSRAAGVRDIALADAAERRHLRGRDTGRRRLRRQRRAVAMQAPPGRCRRAGGASAKELMTASRRSGPGRARQACWPPTAAALPGGSARLGPAPSGFRRCTGHWCVGETWRGTSGWRSAGTGTWLGTVLMSGTPVLPEALKATPCHGGGNGGRRRSSLGGQRRTVAAASAWRGLDFCGFLGGGL